MNWKRKLERNWGRLGMRYKLADLCDIKIGRTPPRKEPQWFNTGLISDYTWVSIKDLGECNKYIDFSSETISLVGQEKFNIPVVKAGTIIMSFKLTVGRLAIVKKNLLTNEAIAQLPIKDPSKVDRDFLYYYLLTYPWNILGSTSSIATAINSKMIKQMEVELPDILIQRKIANILSIVDEKININHAINNNLEQQAQAIFQSWFIDYVPFGGKTPEDWISGILGDFVEIKRGGSPRPIQEYLSPKGLRWLKISDVTGIASPFIIDIKECIKESGLRKTVFLNAGALVLSNSATPGIPKILDVDSCIHDGWLYFAQSKLSNEYLYLYFKFIRKKLVVLGNGSVFTNLKTDILKNYPTELPSEAVLANFESIVKPMFEQILALTRENQRLNILKDTLLPKLMSGELDVSNIDL